MSNHAGCGISDRRGGGGGTESETLGACTRQLVISTRGWAQRCPARRGAVPQRLECEPGLVRQTGVGQQRLHHSLHDLPVQKSGTPTTNWGPEEGGQEIEEDSKGAAETATNASRGGTAEGWPEMAIPPLTNILSDGRLPQVHLATITLYMAAAAPSHQQGDSCRQEAGSYRAVSDAPEIRPSTRSKPWYIDKAWVAN